jgi:hypothetical protein
MACSVSLEQPARLSVRRLGKSVKARMAASVSPVHHTRCSCVGGKERGAGSGVSGGAGGGGVLQPAYFSQMLRRGECHHPIIIHRSAPADIQPVQHWAVLCNHSKSSALYLLLHELK